MTKEREVVLEGLHMQRTVIRTGKSDVYRECQATTPVPGSRSL